LLRKRKCWLLNIVMYSWTDFPTPSTHYTEMLLFSSNLLRAEFHNARLRIDF
jgi:hypothetical protein